MNKQALRDWVRRKKRAMTAAEIDEKSRVLEALFVRSELYRRAKSIYGYLPFNQEVRTEGILCRALAEGKRVAVPKIFKEEMRFVWLTDLTQVAKGYSGIPEPVENGPAACDPEALVILPGLAFDAMGHRVGYGGGFYDRFLAREPNHPTAALCYDFQMFPRLDTEDHDISADLVLWA